jgi:hypothetical protein
VEQAQSADVPRQLYDIACARSGDKGANVNVGVIARSDEAWEMLRSWLTAERVAHFLVPGSRSPRFAKRVDRYELPNLHAINFVIHGILDTVLATDAQGKGYGQRLLEMPLADDTQV